MKKIIAVIVLFVIVFSGIQISYGQILDSPRDGVYDEIHTKNRTPKPYAHVREADVVWKKRVWRMVDMRQKINHPFYYPIEPQQNWKNFVTVLYDAIKANTITAYDAQSDDQFLLPLMPTEIENKLVTVDTVPIRDPNNPDRIIGYEQVVTEFDPSLVERFIVKEDWFFDKQRSVMDVRILGICPMINTYADDDTFLGYERMFWIYFPDAREVLANAEIFNPNNAGQLRTFDDIFWKRKFGSYIIKASNVYDRSIGDYALGMDALLEAERIKNEIFTFEHELWEF